MLERLSEATYVKVNLETGRTHQIRVHFSSIGLNPLVGDAMCGANPKPTEITGLERQWLHAMQLEFKHPRTKMWTTVESNTPNDLRQALEILRHRQSEREKRVKSSSANVTVGSMADVKPSDFVHLPFILTIPCSMVQHLLTLSLKQSKSKVKLL